MALHRKRRQLGARKGEDVVWLDILEPLSNLNPRYATKEQIWGGWRAATGDDNNYVYAIAL
jgi:hypothetical protein